MKIRKIFTYKRMTRATYLLGIVFLLAGMMLSMINQPVAADTAAFQATQPAIKPPPPRGPVPPVKPAPNVPSLPPSDPAPAPAINNNGVRINNQAPALAPNLAKPRIQAIVDGYGIEFTQSNYCLDEPQQVEVTATVRVVLPEGVTATLRTNWRVVHPNNLGELNEIHWSDPVTVTNGQLVDVVGIWPGNTAPGVSPGTEIHFGATLTNPTYGLQEAGLDIYYVDGGCNARPSLTLSAACAENGVQWTVYNPANEAFPASFTYSLDGGPQIPGGIVPGGPGSLMFLTTDRQTHTVTITWEDLVGGKVTSDPVTSEPCGETVPDLTLSHICAENGGVDFRVSNPGDAAVTFEYTVNGGAASSATVAAGAINDVFVNLPAGTAYTVVATWPDGQDGSGTTTETSAADECAPVDLIIAKQCVELGLIRWTVTNPSGETVAYTWDLDAGLTTGSGTLLPGETETVTETSGGAHTLIVTWEDGEETLTSTADECREPTPPNLQLTKVCVEGGNIEWRVTNDGETDTTFTWTLDSGAETGNGSVDAHETVVVTTTPSGAHLLTVTWTEGSVSLTSTAEECGVIDPPLTISKVCYEDGGIQWTVSNDSEIALAFTWSLDGGAHTGGDTVAAGDSLDVIVSSGGAHTFSIEWADGSATLISTAEECGGERVPDLSLVAICADVEGTVIWRVTNPGIEPVTFTWALDGGAEASLTVDGGNDTLDVTTSTTVSAHTMVITWPDGLGGEGTRTTSSEAGACQQEETPTPTPELSLVLRCVDDRIQWTARNSGSETVEFEWELDSNQTGTDDVSAGGSTAFLVSSNGRHTVTLRWPLGAPTRSVSRTSSRDACVPNIETPPVTPTPGIFFTPTPGILITTTPGVFVTATPSNPGVPVTGATPMATVGAPGSTGSGGQVLIPTTGADLTGFGVGLGMLQKLFTNLGLLFLGFALVLHGVGRMR